MKVALFCFVLVCMTTLCVAEESRQEVYIIKKGETLSHVADKFNIHHKKIMEENNMQSVTVHEGMKLKIPSNVKNVVKDKPVVEHKKSSGVHNLVESSAQEKAASVDKNDKSTSEIYIIKKGETLSHVADKFNIHHKKIMEENNMQSITVHEGMKLKIPLNNTEGSHAKKNKIDDSAQTSLKSTEKLPEISESEKSKILTAKKTTNESHFQYPCSSKNFASVDNGILFTGTNDLDVHAARGGVVIYVGDGVQNLKQLVIIKHNVNFTSLYGNLSDVKVKQGEVVSINQVIGKFSSSKQMFFGIRNNGEFIDPLPYLK